MWSLNLAVEPVLIANKSFSNWKNHGKSPDGASSKSSILPRLGAWVTLGFSRQLIINWKFNMRTTPHFLGVRWCLWPCKTAVAKSGAEPGERTALLVLQPRPQPGKSALGTRLVRSLFSVTSPRESRLQLKQSRNAYGLGCASQYSKEIFTRQTCMKIWHQSESIFGHNCDKLTGRGFGKWKSDNSDIKKYHCMLESVAYITQTWVEHPPPPDNVTPTPTPDENFLVVLTAISKPR